MSAEADRVVEACLSRLAQEIGGPLLGLDTSTSVASLCTVGWSGGAVREVALEAAMQPSESVASTLAALFEEAGMRAERLRGIVVGIGPGSFTGLRVGLALAKGLALGGGGVPLYGVSSLAMLAASHGPGRVALALDARRGEAFTALYVVDPHTLEARAEVADAARAPAAFAQLLAREPADLLVGDAAVELRKLGAAGDVVGVPRARAACAVLQCAERLKSGQADDLVALVPRYLRVSEAERQAGEVP